MLLPIGHEQTTVRRMPWVTLTILGACLVTFILTVIAPSGEERATFSEQKVVEYFLDHPYLQLDEQFKGYTYYSLKQQRDRQTIPPPDDHEELQLEQSELDALVEAFYEIRGGTPYFRWGLVPTQQRPVAWFTHMLMHAGLLHLFGNLFILYLAAPPLEDAWGHFPFAVFYVVAGLVAAFFFIAGYPDIDEPLIGASGAIAGVMGAFAVRYWNTRITFFYFFFFFKIYTGTFAAPAWMMLGLWALGQIAFASGWWAFMGMADMGGIAFEAHIAGFVFGVAVAFLVQKLALEERFIDPMIERQQTVHEARSVERALDLAREGQIKEAVRLLEGDLDRNPRDTDAASALWTIAATVGGEPRVAWRMVPALEVSARTGDDGLPALCWGELLRKAPEVNIAPATAVRLGEIVLAAGLDADVATTLHWLEDRMDPSTPVGQLIRLARMADRLGIRAPYAELALARPELPPEVADELRAAFARGRE
jgi:membrane associated rhomboid family serine protease